jgi:hypothetical protein
MNVIVVPAFAETTWEIEVAFLLPVNQESPFLVRLPSVSQPALPAVAGFWVGGPLRVTPCHLATAAQMCPGMKHVLRALRVSGRTEPWTIEKVCGPT